MSNGPTFGNFYLKTMESKKFKRDNYIHVPGYAITELHLSGNELLCYSLIHGFSQDGDSEFTGSLSYIASALNVTKANAKAVVDRLVRKELIVKREIVTNKVKLCRYYINNTPVTETITPPLSEQYRPVIETVPNNTNDIIDTSNDNILGPTIEIVASPVKPLKEELQDLFGEAPTKVKKGTREQLCLFANSKFADFSIFVNEFQSPEFENIDLTYYYHAIADWSASGGKKKHDWIATTRNWMRADKEKGKLHTLNVNSAAENADMVQYLHDMSE